MSCVESPYIQPRLDLAWLADVDGQFFPPAASSHWIPSEMAQMLMPPQPEPFPPNFTDRAVYPACPAWGPSMHPSPIDPDAQLPLHPAFSLGGRDATVPFDGPHPFPSTASTPQESGPSTPVQTSYEPQYAPINATYSASYAPMAQNMHPSVADGSGMFAPQAQSRSGRHTGSHATQAASFAYTNSFVGSNQKRKREEQDISDPSPIPPKKACVGKRRARGCAFQEKHPEIQKSIIEWQLDPLVGQQSSSAPPPFLPVPAPPPVHCATRFASSNATLPPGPVRWPVTFVQVPPTGKIPPIGAVNHRTTTTGEQPFVTGQQPIAINKQPFVIDHKGFVRLDNLVCGPKNEPLPKILPGQNPMLLMSLYRGSELAARRKREGPSFYGNELYNPYTRERAVLRIVHNWAEAWVFFKRLRDRARAVEDLESLEVNSPPPIEPSVPDAAPAIEASVPTSPPQAPAVDAPVPFEDQIFDFTKFCDGEY
ncbi:hypothetical protein C8R46DRAFT_137704 [Mycena filopes]|nr:hypothetical protein C8R46DRAFT_137704 [Mycena filopes]